MKNLKIIMIYFLILIGILGAIVLNFVVAFDLYTKDLNNKENAKQKLMQEYNLY